jgi:hypothetical protein
VIKPTYFLPVLFLAPVLAQTVALRGVITDESGGVVPGATVKLNGPAGAIQQTATGPDGSYSMSGLPAGSYTVQVSAPGLALSQPGRIVLKSGVQMLNLQLKVAALSEQVTVQETTGSTVSPEPANNASALVLRGDDLQALADDPTDLAADLQALAGPAAGPNGGQIFIDGFSGGQLPSKDAIREIRINQNPFSPEYDKLGFGRIEIFTKPGSEKFHGAGFYNFSDDFWNSRNPYAAQKAPFLLREYGGNLGGPINKRSSFFVDVRRDATDNGSIINAVTVDATTLGIVPFTGVYRVPQRSLRASPRLDYQLSASHTLSLRYALSQMDIPGAGIGSFNLVSRGYDAFTTAHTVQLTETAVLNARTINEIRFQFFRAGSEDIARNSSPAIEVLGSFNGGGAQIGHAFDTQNSYEFQDYVSTVRGNHNWRFGIRLRGQTDSSISPQNFGGTFTFGGGTGPPLDAMDTSRAIPIQSIEQYRRTLLFQKLGYTAARIRELGGGVTQFSITTGDTALAVRQFDAGAFVGDDWRVRPNLTLSLGLRYENQTNLSDWRDFAPRAGVAWAPWAGGKNARPKTVLRVGFGMFYDRFSLANTLAAERYNGRVQRQYVVANPDFFPSIPPLSSLAGAQSTQIIQKAASDLRAPYILQSAAGVERQLPRRTTVAVTYANSHGLHMLRSRDSNAPMPGTYDPNTPGSGLFPFGAPGPIFLMESAGLYNQHQLIVNFNTRMNPNVSLAGAYMLNRAMSNTDGLNTFPANPYDFRGEYGAAATDVRHRMSLGGSLNTRWNVRLSPLVVIESGPPFDITVGQDLYGTTIFNARPGVATDASKPGVIRTVYGLLDPNPAPGEQILPRNYGRGPGSILVNCRVAKTIGFGHGRQETSAAAAPSGGGEARRAPSGPFSTGSGMQSIFGATPTARPYNVIISMGIRNVINHNNPGAIIGRITSPLFGQANQPAGSRDLGGGGFSEAANNRRLELQVRFTF